MSPSATTHTPVQNEGITPQHNVVTKAATPAAAAAANSSAATANGNDNSRSQTAQGNGESVPFNATTSVAQSKGRSGKGAGKTFAAQDELPKLPIPKLEDTCKRYLTCLEPLQVGFLSTLPSLSGMYADALLREQDPDDHEATKRIVEDFLKKEGPQLHKDLEEYASTRPSYISEFWDESYLQASDSVVLSLNPFFILE